MEELVVDFCKFLFKLNLLLHLVIECFNCQDCNPPIKPIYGNYHLEDNKVTYTCMKGYGLMGFSPRFCIHGKWSDLSPICVKAATAVVDDWKINNLTDGNSETCIYVSNGIFLSFFGLDVSSNFILDGDFSYAIIRVIMTPYLISYKTTIVMNKKECQEILSVKEGKFATYEYNCSLVNIKNRIEINIKRNRRFEICEIQVFPIKKTVCPLLDLSIENANITYDPEVSGNSVSYGTAARYSCKDNRTLQGSEVRYCIDGNHWSGNQTYCKDKHEETSVLLRHFQVIIISTAASGFIIIVIIIIVCIVTRKRRSRVSSSQVIEIYDAGTPRISVIENYYNTVYYGESSIRTSFPSTNEEYDYCTVTEPASCDVPTNWKFSKFSFKKRSRPPVQLLDNEVYMSD